jgi:D-alanine-D-alanine ligase
VSGPSVAVLHGAAPGTGADEEDTLIQAEAVSEALRRFGWTPSILGLTLDLQAAAEDLASLAPAFVFNLVESIGGKGCFIHLAPTLLDSLGFAYTGASAEAIMQTQNKLTGKRIMAAAGIPTPDWIEPEALVEGAARLDGPFIVKSSWDHASIGLDAASIADDAAALRRVALDRRSRFGGAWYAERYIEGREIVIALVGPIDRPVILPASEIRFLDPSRPRIVDYVSKWHTGSPEYLNTPRSFVDDPADGPLLRRLEDVARRCWALFRLSGYVRIDFRIDADGRPFVLEVNTNPCLAPDAGLAAVAGRAGWSYDRLVQAILSAAGLPAIARSAAE